MIEPDETEIEGHWLPPGSEVVGDENCRRIRALTQNYLIKIGYYVDGWDTLYRDPGDGRFWELIYPESYQHGGGPPLLRVLTAPAAREKYGDMVE